MSRENAELNGVVVSAMLNVSKRQPKEMEDGLHKCLLKETFDLHEPINLVMFAYTLGYIQSLREADMYKGYDVELLFRTLAKATLDLTVEKERRDSSGS